MSTRTVTAGIQSSFTAEKTVKFPAKLVLTFSITA